MTREWMAGACRDEDDGQVGGHGGVAGLADARQVQAIPGGLAELEGAVRLQLQRVVRAQLHMLVLCQVLAAQPDLLACRNGHFAVVTSLSTAALPRATPDIRICSNAGCDTFRVKVDGLDADAELEFDLLALLPSAALALDFAKCCCGDQIPRSHQVVHVPQILPCWTHPCRSLRTTVTRLHQTMIW
jgi:hypothetical protein